MQYHYQKSLEENQLKAYCLSHSIVLATIRLQGSHYFWRPETNGGFMPVNRNIQVSLFGALDFRVGGVSQHLGVSGPTRSLLQYLFCFHGRPTRREQLVEMFWPATRAERRRSSLNSAIWRIKKGLKAYPVLGVDASADCVRLAGADDPAIEVDFIRLENALRDVGGRTADESSSLSALLAALDECEAEPLDGVDGDWATIERERLSALRMRALTTAMRTLSSHKRYDEALEMGRRILIKEPYRECAFQEVMCLHVLNGQRARAMQIFDEFSSALNTELGIEPTVETKVLRDYLVSDRCYDNATKRNAIVTVIEYPSRPGIDELLCTIEQSRIVLRESAIRAIA